MVLQEDFLIYDCKHVSKSWPTKLSAEPKKITPLLSGMLKLKQAAKDDIMTRLKLQQLNKKLNDVSFR